MDSPTSRRNWRLILFQGLFYSLKRRLAPPKVFLPFICVAAGAPVFLAALVVPLFTFAARTSELVSAPLVSGARQRKTYVISGIVGIAIGLLIAIVAIESRSALVTTICMAVAAIVIGIGRGIGSLAYSTLLPSLFGKEGRGHLLNLEGVLSALASMAIAVAAFSVFRNSDPLHSHIALAWLAFLVAIPAVILLLPVREPERPSLAVKRSDRSGERGFNGVKRRFLYCWQIAGFRKYLTARILLLSVTQVMPFYAIHAASLHKDQSGSYAGFVIAMSVGGILSGPILYRLAGRSTAVNLATAIGASMLAALLALCEDLALTGPHFLLYVPVLVLVALAAQIATVAVTVYLGEIGSDGDREYFVATSRFVSGVIGTAVAAILGLLAQLHDEAIPIAIILAANAAALAVVLLVLPEQPEGNKAE
ncbi:hypothetical protein [Roseibium sp. M-1]